MTSKEISTNIGKTLMQRQETLSAAESCTGGNISHLLTIVPGASNYYLGSVTSYAVPVKEQILGVDANLIKSKGVVSAEVAEAMAEGIKRLLHSTYSVATTGLAGPGGDEYNAEGTVWMAVCGPNGTLSKKLVCPNQNREQNIESFTHAALNFLYEQIIAD